MRDAYVVLWIDANTAKVTSVGIYSEPHPTTHNALRTVVFLKMSGVDYGDARGKAELALEGYCRTFRPEAELGRLFRDCIRKRG